MLAKTNLFGILVALATLASSPAYAVNGCCQDVGKGGKNCGAPIKGLHNELGCSLGWYKASCTTKWKDCTKKDWMLPGGKLKAR